MDGSPDEQFDNAAVQAFVAQPAEHADEDRDDVDVVATRAPSESWRTRLRRFFFEKKPGQYSSIAPRMPDGRRTKPFFFNGNGRGR